MAESGSSFGSLSLTTGVTATGTGKTYTSSWSYGPAPPRVTPAAPSPPPPITPVTPTIDPKIEANALYGKPIIISALGLARIGATGAPIVGPYLSAGKVDMIVSFGFAVPVDGDRKLYAIYLDNEKAWESTGGGTLPGDGTFLSEAFDFTFRPGRLDQAVLSLETAHFPAAANAYRPEMVLEIRNLPYARFMANTGKPVPYVAADIGDVTGGADPDDGINLGTALERIAHSPWAGYTAANFEAVNVTDVVDGIIMAENFTVIQLCQSITGYYRNIHLLQSDKLYLKDHGSNVTPVITLDRDTIVGGESAVGISRSGPSEQKREEELTTIDPDQDYTRVPSIARRPREPVAVSASVGKGSGTLPVIIDADTRQALVTFAQYDKENSRKRYTFSTMFAGYEIEPGDLVALEDIADGIDNEVILIEETAHGGDFTVEMTGRAILRCGITYNPDSSYLAHYEDGGSVATYTFGSAALGAAADDRLIVVVARVMRSQSIGRDISSVTLGGTAMTERAHLVAGDGAPSANAAVTQGIYSMLVASGTTASIVINVAGVAAGAAIDVYRLTGLGSITPHDTMSVQSNASNPSGTIDVPFNGILIATYAGVGSPGSASWTGASTVNVNEVHDGTVTGNWWGSSASQSGMAAETARPVAVTDAASGYENLLAVSFG